MNCTRCAESNCTICPECDEPSCGFCECGELFTTCDYCEQLNVPIINGMAADWCSNCAPGMTEDGRCTRCRDYARDCQC